MDRQLKERLIGAVILSLLTAIFLPLVFDERVKPNGMDAANIRETPFDGGGSPGKTNRTAKNTTVIDKHTIDNRLQPVEGKPLTGIRSAWVIQVGSFSAADNASALRSQLRKAGFSVIIQDSKGKGSVIYRVRIGPFSRRPEAEKSLERLQSQLGLKEGIILSLPTKNQ